MLYEVITLVLKNVGVTSPGRDSREKYILECLAGNVKIEGDGIVNTVEEAGGWPELKSKPAPLDSDGDGILV